MARLNTSFGPLQLLSIFVVISDIGAFFVLLGGASALQHKANIIAPLLNMDSATLAYMDLTPQTVPRKFISYEWFKAVLQIVSLLFCLGALASGQFYRCRVAMVGLMAVTAALWCGSCQTFYYVRTQVDAAEAVTGSYIAKAVRAYWAGCMLSAGFNLSLIVLLGIGLETVTAQPAATNYNTGKGASAVGNENGNYANGNTTV